MKTKSLGLLCAAISCVIPACPALSGLEIITHTPYGSGSYHDGVITVTPTVPIAIPIHGTK